MTSLELDEPLVESAARAWGLAAAHCTPACDWYHGLWPTLRVLGLAASPDRQSDFFLAALGSAAASGACAGVLVSGSADFSMLAHVVGAYRAHGADLRATALDRCPTPLALCRWYGDLVGVGVDTVASDIVHFAADDPFDVVCTHSFLSQFAAADRPALLAAWRSALRPEGRVITTTRVNPPDTAAVLTFSPDQLDAFCDQVLAEAVPRQNLLAHSSDDLVSAARVYAERLSLYPTHSVDELSNLFETTGFRLESLHLRELPGSMRGGPSGPGTRQAATYAEIVAVRA